jgi:hypothetical protein
MQPAISIIILKNSSLVHLKSLLMYKEHIKWDKLADNKDAAYGHGVVASAVAANYDRLPENVQNLADNKHAAGEIAYSVNRNFDELPENVRNELLVKLAGHSEEQWIWIVVI